MRVIAFIGPSRPRLLSDSARIEWHGPAVRGDFDALDVSEGDVVALVDGVMITGHSPSPTECFRLISRGVRLVGSSSLGALRAVELRDLGMTGYGWVYDKVLDRTVTCDDELVSDLDPRTYEARTVFLVNVRFGLEAALAEGMLSPDVACLAVSGLSELHFSERSRVAVAAVMRTAGMTSRAVEYVLDDRHDIKKRDAELLFDAIAPGGVR